MSSTHTTLSPKPLATRAVPLALAISLAALLLAACSPTAATRRSAAAALTHQTRAAIPATRTITYVALGASDAFGVGTDDPDHQNWPSVLARKLGSNVHLVNVGMPGATLAQAQRMELPIALDAHPDIVTIWLAVNDIAANVDVSTYSSELASVLDALHQRTHAQIFVGNVPDLTLLPAFSDQNPGLLEARVQAWNAAIATDCAAHHAHLVDIASAWSELANHPEYIAPDGLHPSTVGAARLADLFALTIQRAGVA